MKRFLAAMLALLYTGTSMGATLHMHYCMDKLAAWSLTVNTIEPCSACDNSKPGLVKKSCCHDEQKTFKPGDQQAAESYFKSINVKAAAIPATLLEVPSPRIFSITEAIPVTNSPPRYSYGEIYLLNCDFRI